MEKILIVDDDRVTRIVCAKIVSSMGYVCVEASNGKLALDILRDNEDIKLAIVDMLMPDLCGEEVITALRADPRFKELPIIIISGVVSIDQISGILELGASRFLPKPIHAEYLRDYMRDLLKTALINPIGAAAPTHARD